MLGVIDGVNFREMEPQRYYAPPASWSIEKKTQLARSRIFGGEFLGARKMDGYFTKFIKDEDGNQMLLSRSRGINGDFADKYELVPHLHEFFDKLPNGTCLLGEAYLPSCPGSSNVTKLLGCLKEKAIARQEKGEKINFYVFDVLAFDDKSYMNKTAEARFSELDSLSTIYSSFEFVQWAHYYRGKELWNVLQTVLAEGGEGIVITRDKSFYQPGKRPSKDCQKVKKEVQQSLDLVVIGGNAPTRLYNGKYIEDWTYWEDPTTKEKFNERFYRDYSNGRVIEPITKAYYNGWAGSLALGAKKNGEMVHVGNLSGITEDVLENWKDYVGRVVEVGAMEVLYDDNGKFSGLRHPRFLQWRDDKTPENATTWEELNG